MQGEVDFPLLYISSLGDDTGSPCHSTKAGEHLQEKSKAHRGSHQQFGGAFPKHTHTHGCPVAGINSQIWSKSLDEKSPHPQQRLTDLREGHFVRKWVMKLKRAVLNPDSYHQYTGNPGRKYPIFTGDLLLLIITDLVMQRWDVCWVQSLHLSVWQRFIEAHQKETRQDCVTWLAICFKESKSWPGQEMNLAQSRTNPTHNTGP